MHNNRLKLFILNDLFENLCPISCRILDFSQPWHESFIKSRKMIQKNLHILHPVMQTVLEIGYTTFSPLVLVDLSWCRFEKTPQMHHGAVHVVTMIHFQEDLLKFLSDFMLPSFGLGLQDLWTVRACRTKWLWCVRGQKIPS